MYAIYKYPLRFNSIGAETIDMPVGARILSVQMQGDTITLWALVQPGSKTETVRFTMIGTGWELPDDFATKNLYLGTVQYESLVWHIFKNL